mmetsp:Transcript_39847/g.40356  ORF Transcript_39847/g.40356 Transcript_39847/m.40356 type:complete len:212 (+) Transcript_39847:462-1097(+)
MAVMIMATTTRGTVMFVCVREEASDAAVSAVFISVVVVDVVSDVTGVATGGRSVIVGVGAVPSSSVAVVLPSSALALALISSSILSAGVAIFSSIGGVVWGASDVAVTVTGSSSSPPSLPVSDASSAPPAGTPTGSRSPRSGLNMGSLLSGVLLLVVVEAESGSAAGSSSPSHWILPSASHIHTPSSAGSKSHEIILSASQRQESNISKVS